MVAARRADSRRFRRRSRTAAHWHSAGGCGSGASGDEGSGGDSDGGGSDGGTPSSPAVVAAAAAAASAVVPCYLADASLRSAVRLMSEPGAHAAVPVPAKASGGASGGSSGGGSSSTAGAAKSPRVRWPSHWPVQVIGRVQTTEPCVATADDNPYDLPQGALYFKVEVHVLDCRPFLTRSHTSTSAGTGQADLEAADLGPPSTDDDGRAPGPVVNAGGSGRVVVGSGSRAMLPPLCAHKFQRTGSPRSEEHTSELQSHV